MIKFEYKDKLKLKELLIKSNFLVSEDSKQLKAKFQYDRDCYVDDNVFYKTLYSTLSLTPNIADLKFTIDSAYHTVTFNNAIFPEDEFISLCLKDDYSVNVYGKIGFHTSYPNHLRVVVNKHKELFGTILNGFMIIFHDDIIFVTDYNYP